ncbi:MAG TPA: PKD domain-containing protein [Flavipsychrobacter sp.]
MQRLLPFLVLLAIAACSKKGNNTTTNTPPKTTTPSADFTFTGDTFTHSTLTFTPNITTAVTWHFGDGATSTLQQPSYSYPLPGTYQVMMTADTDTVRKSIHIDTGLHRLQRFKKWHVSAHSFEIINTLPYNHKHEFERDVVFTLTTVNNTRIVIPDDTVYNPIGNIFLPLVHMSSAGWFFSGSIGSNSNYYVHEDSMHIFIRADKDNRRYLIDYSTIR